MVIGVFACLFGVGFILHSLSMVCVWTVLFALNAIELKVVEEPELELRFGANYIAYRRRVPMFVPTPPGRSTSNPVA
jgi:protein-S-isoprenylcysteine O-methyltransferase Ste14